MNKQQIVQGLYIAARIFMYTTLIAYTILMWYVIVHVVNKIL